MADEPTLIELDARNRASLGKLARHRRYLAKLETDGTITLVPARIVPAQEVAHLDRLAAIDELADLPDAAASQWSSDLSRLERPAPFACDTCGRKSVHNGLCGMTQPDGARCEGTLT